MSAQWTVMVYMAGNNNLSGAAGNDLEEMRQVGSSDDVQVRAFVKQADGAGARRLRVTDGGQDDVEELGDVDSGDPQTVVDFVRWAAERSPAERYALVLWNHGGGWQPGQLDAVSTQVRGGQPERARRSESNRRATQSAARALFSTTIREIASLSPRGERDICNDDGTGHSLDTIELGRVTGLLHRELGQPLDLLGMDACLMSNFEVAYQVRDDATAVVASEELEPNDGWPYDELLPRLAKDPSLDGPALGRLVVERYIESYRDQREAWPVTQAALETAQVESLTQPLDALAKALSDEMATAWPALYSAHTKAVRFHNDLIDLASLCAGLRGDALPAPVREAAKAVEDALAPGGYVVAEGHLGDAVEGCRGISVYMPAPTSPVSKFYRQLDFAKSHRWDGMLAAYRRAVRGGA